MKVSRIEIKDVNQFKDIDIDLTYPKGHAKEGKPLEKVCFIGQSGTGKTTLLKFIYAMTYKTNILSKDYEMDLIHENLFVTNWTEGNSFRNFISKSNDDPKNLYALMNVKFKDRHLKMPPKEALEYAKDFFRKARNHIKTQIIYFPAEMKYEATYNISDTPKGNQKIYDFREENISKVWNILIEEIQNQQEKELILTQKISKIAIEENADTQKLQEVIDELKKIRNSRSNPLIRVANKCLDPILKHFNLKVKTELDIKTKEDIGFIKIVDIHGTEIPNALLSTGTKQIILSALPLYILNPEQTIILYDEPERSLYPDMQKLVVDYYTSFTKDSQFFFATHSPIIASCFDPWEIVELKFDKEGYVVQEKYYEGERHVDNYTINPKYLTYDLMLSKMFDVDEPSSAERNKKITEFLSHKGRLDFMKKEGMTTDPEYKQTFDEYISIGKKLFWDTSMAV